MLTKEQKQKWANALRSGDYKQERDRLCNTGNLQTADCYCCLGVLVHVVDPTEIFAYPLNLYLLSAEAEVEFTQMNDVEKMSFSEIANEVDRLPTID